MKRSLHRKSKVVSLALKYLVSLILLFFALFPLIWMFMTSFKIQVEALAIPPKWLFIPTLDNYREVFMGNGFGRCYLNSLIVVILSVGISLIIGVPAAYALTRFEFPGKKPLLLWILSTRLAPPIAFLIPFFIMFRILGLIDTIAGLVIIYVAINLTMVIWMMKGFFGDVPKEIEEASLVDGCTPLQTLTRIVLPICLSGLAATAVLIFIFTWNELMFAIVLTSNVAKTAPAGIYNFIGYNEVRWGALTAASTLVVIPVLVFLLLTKRYLIRGLSFGAIK